MINRLLFWLSGFLPCRLIKPGGQPYLERYHVLALGQWRVYLHRFHAPDGQGHHDHPFGWSLAIPLCGGYLEERVRHLDPFAGPVIRHRRMFPGRPNRIRAGDFHRIASVKPGTWTLFIHGPRAVVDGRDKHWGHLCPVDEASGQILYLASASTGTDPDWHRSARSGWGAGREGAQRRGG